MSLLLIALSLLPVILLLVFIYRQDKYEKEPLGLLLLAFLAGMIAIPIDLTLVTFANAIHYSGWTGQAVTVPVSEDLFEEELKKKTAGSHVRKTGDITFESDHRGTGARK